jgi:WD40-like Beta Propeller Repeat
MDGLAFVALGLALALQFGQASEMRNRRTAGPLSHAREVTGHVHKFDEIQPACSPDGRWLAFEYSEISDPNFPRVGIMRLDGDRPSWNALLEAPVGSQLFVGDFSWSPDSQWLAVITNYDPGGKTPFSEASLQIVKININTREAVPLTSFPVNTSLGPTTAWLRSGLIVFPGPNGNIYGVSTTGGAVRKLINIPPDKCGGLTNTLAVSRDEEKIAFAMDSHDDSHASDCDSLWIGDFRTGNLRRVPTTGLHPLSPFWLDARTVLFSGEVRDQPVGIYSLSLGAGKVSALLRGTLRTPFVCDVGKMLYFSQGPNPRSRSQTADWQILNDSYGFHIWKIPLSHVFPYDPYKVSRGH